MDRSLVDVAIGIEGLVAVMKPVQGHHKLPRLAEVRPVLCRKQALWQPAMGPDTVEWTEFVVFRRQASEKTIPKGW